MLNKIVCFKNLLQKVHFPLFCMELQIINATSVQIWVSLASSIYCGHGHDRILHYSWFTNFTELFYANSSKTTKQKCDKVVMKVP